MSFILIVYVFQADDFVFSQQKYLVGYYYLRHSTQTGSRDACWLAAFLDEPKFYLANRVRGRRMLRKYRQW